MGWNANKQDWWSRERWRYIHGVVIHFIVAFVEIKQNLIFMYCQFSAKIVIYSNIVYFHYKLWFMKIHVNHWTISWNLVIIIPMDWHAKWNRTRKCIHPSHEMNTHSIGCLQSRRISYFESRRAFNHSITETRPNSNGFSGRTRTKHSKLQSLSRKPKTRIKQSNSFWSYDGSSSSSAARQHEQGTGKKFCTKSCLK